jgi:hypothetical protein
MPSDPRLRLDFGLSRYSGDLAESAEGPHAPRAGGQSTRDAQGHVASMLARAGVGIRCYEVIKTHLKRGNIRASSHRCVGSSCRIGTSHSHCQHADCEDRTKDSIRFKPPIEFVLFFRRHPLIRDLICHDSLSLQPR